MPKVKKPKMNPKVGYCKPPVHTQFQPGQTGNRRGRPKLSRDLEALVRKAVNKKAVVTVQGRRRKLTKLEISLDQLANKSASGDIRATLTIAKLLGYPKQKVVQPPDMEEMMNKMGQKLAELSDEDLKALSDLYTRLGFDKLFPTE